MGSALILLAACAPGEGVVEDTGVPDGEVSAVIGVEGGELTHPGGGAVVIPAGALAGDTTVILTREEGLWKLDPLDIVLAVPGTLCLPGDPTERVRWLTPQGLQPLVTTWGADGLGCASIGRFGAGDATEIAAFAGRPELGDRSVALVPADDGLHWVATVDVYHAHGATRTTGVVTWFPDGAAHGMLDPLDRGADFCAQTDAWTNACAQDLLVADAPRWAWLGALDDDGEFADFAIWEIPAP